MSEWTSMRDRGIAHKKTVHGKVCRETEMDEEGSDDGERDRQRNRGRERERIKI